MQNSDINISELIKKIEADEFDHIDSFVLSNFVKIVHQLGLKKGEVLKLKIKDVIDKSEEVVKQINIGKREMKVSPEVETIIKAQIDHLKNNDNYTANRNSPLFQDKKGGKYSETARQLRDKFDSPKLEKIRQSGLRRYYESLEKNSDAARMREMIKFTGLSDKEINGILIGKIQEAGNKQAEYEKDSYMDEVIDHLKNNNDIDWSELMFIPEKLSEFKLNNLKEVEKLKNAYFNAVDGNVALNEDKEGVDEQIKDNSKKIFKEWLLEKFHDVGIDFDANTNKAKKIPKAEKIEEFKTAKDIYEAIKRLRPDLCDLFSQLDKARGIIYGLAIGDALGYPTEFMSLFQIKEKYGSPGIQDLPKAPAFFTDDTQMSIAIAEALIKAGDSDIETLMAAVKDEFIKWYHSPENNRAPGKACLSGVANMERGKHWSESGVPNSKGCGSAMRVATIGYLYQNDPVKLKEVAHATGICTHGHPTGDAACIGAAYLVKLAMGGIEPSKMIPELLSFTSGISDEFDKAISKINKCLDWKDEEKALEYLGEGWIGEEAVALALYCFLKYNDNYKRMVIRAANTNGDSDSIACIAGSMGGAYLGINGIPNDWVQRIEKSNYLDDLAIRLAEKKARSDND